jgi:hypothetical protein
MFDVLITTTAQPSFQGCPVLVLPFAITEMYRRPKRKIQDLILPPGYDAAAKLKEKTAFAAFLYTDCFKPIYHGKDFMLRVIFFDLLSDYKPVSALGECRRVGPRVEHVKETFHDDMPVDIYKPYKFVVSFENTEVQSYVTEKVVNGILSHSIPIYFGPPELGTLINPDRIIHCDLTKEELAAFRESPKPTTELQFEEQVAAWKEPLRKAFQPCIDRVKELDKDDEKYKAVLSQWAVKNNQIAGSPWDIRFFLHHLNLIWKRIGSRLYDPCYTLH